MNQEVSGVIHDARNLIKHPQSWIGCFALSKDSEERDLWEIEELEKADRLSICGAIDVAAHRRGHKVHGHGYGKTVTDKVVMFMYPLIWKAITAPFPFPSDLYEDLAEGGSFLYEEYGYFNEEADHPTVMKALNLALAHAYCKTAPRLPAPQAAAVHAFGELAEENKRKGITPP